MFILTKVADLVQFPPEDFAKKSLSAIEDTINAKYARKVIQKIGLCICLYDLLWASEGLIGHGDGYVNVNVEFRLVVFRPFRGQVIFARIHSCSNEGIRLRTDFFHDIFVPYDELPDETEFDHVQQQWVWTPAGERMYFDINEIVRVRVVEEEWNDQTPTGPIDYKLKSKEGPASPYIIKGSMKEAGLGHCMWWD